MEKEIEPKSKTLAQSLYLPPIYSSPPKGFVFANIQAFDCAGYLY